MPDPEPDPDVRPDVDPNLNRETDFEPNPNTVHYNIITFYVSLGYCTTQTTYHLCLILSQILIQTHCQIVI